MNDYESTLKSYMKEIAKRPVLTREEEIHLFQRLEKGDKSARTEIIEANLRFVVKIALKYSGKGLSLSDLIQEGNIGLMEVIDKYDWRKGFRFSTYAAFWIKQTIQLAIRRYNSIVKLPFRKARLMGRITEFINNFLMNNGREPNESEISEGVGIEKSKLSTVMPWRESILSLDVSLTENGDFTLHETISNHSPSPHDICLEHEQHEKIYRAMSLLTDRERNVVKLRYGFGGEEPLSLRQTSKIIGLSQEGIRKIEKRALDKLRRPATLADLTGLL